MNNKTNKAIPDRSIDESELVNRIKNSKESVIEGRLIPHKEVKRIYRLKAKN
jgi:hypothetical protein